MNELKPVKLKNDRKAPRFGKGDFTYNVVSKELHEEWKKANPQYSHFTYREFLDVWDMVTDEIHNQLVTNTDGVRLPYYNGDLVLNLLMTNKKIRNEKASEELGRPVYELNWNTGKKPGKIIWSIKHARKRNKWLVLYGTEIDRKLRAKAFYAFQDHPEIFRVARVTEGNAIMFDEIKKGIRNG